MPYSGPGQPVNRREIKQALFDLATNSYFPFPINGFSTWQMTGRRLKLFKDLDPSNQPAMFMIQHKEGYLSSGVGRLTRRYLDMGFWCYAPTGDDSVVGDDYLDSMEYALEQILVPDDPIRNELTLGNLVYWVRIVREDGLFIRDPGDIDGQALLVLPVRVLIP